MSLKFSQTIDRNLPISGQIKAKVLAINDAEAGRGAMVYFVCEHCEVPYNNMQFRLTSSVSRERILEGIKKRGYFLVRHKCLTGDCCNEVRISL